jgi:hypothetical protein
MVNQTKPTQPIHSEDSTKRRRMNNGSIEEKTTNVFEITNQEKKNNMEHSQHKPKNPTMTGKEQLHRLKEKERNEREREKDSIGAERLEACSFQR